VASEADLDAKVDELVTALKKNGPEAIKVAKRLALEVPQLTATRARELTVQTIAEQRTSPEGQEGLKAFLEKREPRWP
jgi:methylglutaconyl-CoA hydratase